MHVDDFVFGTGLPQWFVSLVSRCRVFAVNTHKPVHVEESDVWSLQTQWLVARCQRFVARR